MIAPPTRLTRRASHTTVRMILVYSGSLTHIAVMRSGTYVEDLDQKKSSLCTMCKKTMDKCLT